MCSCIPQSPKSGHLQSSNMSVPKAAMAMRQPSLVAPEQKAKWPGMLPPPMSCLITEAQLTAEIKAIYAGVVVVEEKCRNVDAAEANDPSPDFDQARWQALIGLHRNSCTSTTTSSWRPSTPLLHRHSVRFRRSIPCLPGCGSMPFTGSWKFSVIGGQNCKTTLSTSYTWPTRWSLSCTRPSLLISITG